MNNHIGLLKTLASIFSPSGNEDKMVKYLKKFCKRVPNTKVNIDKYGNLYVTRGESETYPCVVAHCDQVSFVHHDSDFSCILHNGVLFGYSAKKMRMNNCGWDDKAGIAIALVCLQEFDVFKCAFFRQEEEGAIGSGNADMEFFNNVRFVIEPDRRGNSDLITEIGHDEICSEEFADATNFSLFGYKRENGLLTDVIELKENGLDVACVNVSCGYYNPHTDNEALVIEDWKKCLDFVMFIVNTCTDVFTHVMPLTYMSLFGKYDILNNYNNNGTRKVKVVENVSEKDLDDLYWDLYGKVSVDDMFSEKDAIDYAKDKYKQFSEEDVKRVYDELLEDIMETY